MAQRAFSVLALLVSFSAGVFAQPAGWAKEQKTDPLRGTNYVVYKLDGKFLAPPRQIKPDALPSIILQCTPGSFTRGHLHGRLLKGYVYVGTVIDTQVSSLSGSVRAKFRLDDGKLQDAPWSHSTDYSSVFFDDTDLNTLLYGHFMPHKENTSPPVKKVVIGFDEYLGGEVVMQFDMPDPTEVADACGVIWHK
jgi:hypothetical protein